MWRIDRSSEHVSLSGDKRSHSRCSYFVGFFSGKDPWREYYIGDCTQGPQLIVIYVWALRKTVHTFSSDASSLELYGLDKLY